jgi:hypothetical protein
MVTMTETVTDTPRLDDGIAFTFTTLTGRHEVHGRYFTPDELYRTPGRRARAYVEIDPADVPIEQPPYGSVRGDGSDEDKAWAAFNRAEITAMRRKLAEVTPVLEAAYALPSGATWQFSRKAGCSMCDCSPGFVLGGQVTVMGWRVPRNYRDETRWVPLP